MTVNSLSKSTHYKRLGFTPLETAEIVQNLNHLLANYSVFYQKLRGFHWNVEGRDFFELHAQFELEYKAVEEEIDQIAERIRIFGQRPFRTLSEFMEAAEIAETPAGLTGQAMVIEVKNDLEVIFSHLTELADACNKAGDIGTLNLVQKMLERTEKRHWMYSSWLHEIKS